MQAVSDIGIATRRWQEEAVNTSNLLKELLETERGYEQSIRPDGTKKKEHELSLARIAVIGALLAKMKGEEEFPIEDARCEALLKKAIDVAAASIVMHARVVERTTAVLLGRPVGRALRRAGV